MVTGDEGLPPGATGRVQDYAAPEDTGPIRAELQRAAAEPAPTAHQIAAALAEIMGGLTDAPPAALRKIHHKNWLANLAIALVVAASGALAAYKATEDRSKTNADGVRANAAAVGQIRQDLSGLRESARGILSSLGEVRREVERMEKTSRAAETARLRDRATALERRNRELERRRELRQELNGKAGGP